MGVPFAEDLDLFFDGADFAQVVQFSPQGNPAFSVNGQFYNPYHTNTIGDDFGIASSEPKIVCKTTAEVATLVKGDALIVDGQNFKVKQNQDDSSTGISHIILKAGS